MSKRENEVNPLKYLMNSFIKENNLSKGIIKLEIKEAWNKLMGPGIVSYTNEVQLQNSTLVVRLSSSILREELSYGKEKIIRMINDEMGEDLVKNLILV